MVTEMDIVANIRIVEDSLAFVLLLIALTTLFSAGLRLKGLKVRLIPLSLAAGLIPLFFWKGLGMTRRVFVDKAIYSDLYKQMNHIGEVFESLSGLAIAISVIFILMTLRKMVRASRARAE
jgi:ABC-type polysaccharide/polyol phosphate export permease